MSDTPRTDALADELDAGLPSRDAEHGLYRRLFDLSSELEREVNALHAQIRLMDSKPTNAEPQPIKLGFADAVRKYGDDWLFDNRFSWEGKLSADTRCALMEMVTQDFKDYQTMQSCTSHGRLFQVDV